MHHNQKTIDQQELRAEGAGEEESQRIVVRTIDHLRSRWLFRSNGSTAGGRPAGTSGRSTSAGSTRPGTESPPMS